jgi:hypothetical protein
MKGGEKYYGGMVKEISGNYCGGSLVLFPHNVKDSIYDIETTGTFQFVACSCLTLFEKIVKGKNRKVSFDKNAIVISDSIFGKVTFTNG